MKKAIAPLIGARIGKALATTDWEDDGPSRAPMRCGHFDGPQRFRVEPGVAMTKAEPADRAKLAIDHGELEFATARSGPNLSPLRVIEKSE